jgi:hypothetical protein
MVFCCTQQPGIHIQVLHWGVCIEHLEMLVLLLSYNQGQLAAVILMSKWHACMYESTSTLLHLFDATCQPVLQAATCCPHAAVFPR